MGEVPKKARTEVPLVLDDSDLDGVKFPHDDPLVITPIIGNSPVKRVLEGQWSIGGYPFL